MKLFIANQKYSSWSFRPWLLMKMTEIPFEIEKIFLKKPDTAKKIQKVSPSGCVPALVDGKVTVWDSLAICEYLAGKYPEKKMWPEDPAAKAEARSISCEMHSGFSEMRRQLPCHFLARYKDFVIADEVRPDIERILSIWSSARKQWSKEGPFLFGAFTIADAMFAPVVFRFEAYGVKGDKISEAYRKSILSLPASEEWVKGARAEKERIPAYEFTWQPSEIWD